MTRLGCYKTRSGVYGPRDEGGWHYSAEQIDGFHNQIASGETLERLAESINERFRGDLHLVKTLPTMIASREGTIVSPDGVITTFALDVAEIDEVGRYIHELRTADNE